MMWRAFVAAITFYASAVSGVHAALVLGEPIVLEGGDALATSGLTAGDYEPCLEDAYAGSYHTAYTRTRSFEHTAVFHFDPPEDSCYVVEEWHSGGTERCRRFMSDAVRLDVSYSKGKGAYAYVDQSTSGGRWNIVGALPFYKAWPGNLSLSNGRGTCRQGNGCFWTADAFRLTKVTRSEGEGCEAPSSMPDAAYNPAAPLRTPTLTTPAAVAAPVAEQRLHDVPPTLLDDADVSADNAWSVESVEAPVLQCQRQGWGQRFLFMDPLESSNLEAHVDFAFEPQADGCYLVEEFHPSNVCEKSLSPEVKFTISSGKGQAVQMTVDQTTGGNQWNTLILLPFYVGNSASIRVQHPQVGAGIAVADAVRFTRVSPSCETASTTLTEYHRLAQHPVSVTVDDRVATMRGEPAGLRTSSASCEGTALFGSAYTAAVGDVSAEFTLVPPSSGCYRLDEFHPVATQECPLTSANLDIAYCLGAATGAVVDLSLDGGRWNVVGHYPFYAGEPGVVTTRRLSGLWAADGFRFTKVSEHCTEVPYSTLLTLRLVGVDLAEPRFTEGHLTRQTDVRLALHAALVSATGLPDEDVRLLGLRSGSIIAEFELAGADSYVAADRARAELAGGASPLERALCGAAVVGQDPVPACRVEVMDLVPINSPVSKAAEDEDSVSHTVLIICLASGAVVFCSFFVVAILMAGPPCAGCARCQHRFSAGAVHRWRHRAEKNKEKNKKPKSEDYNNIPQFMGIVADDEKASDCDTSSTITPSKEQSTFWCPDFSDLHSDDPSSCPPEDDLISQRRKSLEGKSLEEAVDTVA